MEKSHALQGSKINKSHNNVFLSQSMSQAATALIHTSTMVKTERSYVSTVSEMEKSHAVQAAKIKK